MSSEMRCPHCGQVYALTPEQAPQYAGQSITCTSCNRLFVAQVPGYPAPAGAVAVVGPDQPPPLPGPGWNPPAPRTRRNGWAIASLVVAIFGFVIPILPGLIAVLLGIVGLRKTRDPQVRGQGLSIAGISVGGATIVITPLLISILLPSLNAARAQANRIKCSSNLKQLAMGVLMYAEANQGEFPSDLETARQAGSMAPDVLVCPSTRGDRQGSQGSYVYIGKGMNVRDASPRTIIAYELAENHNPAGPTRGKTPGGNCAFADGHVEYVRDIATVIREIEAGQNPPLSLP